MSSATDSSIDGQSSSRYLKNRKPVSTIHSPEPASDDHEDTTLPRRKPAAGMSFIDILRLIGGLVLLSTSVSYFVMDSLTWGYNPPWLRLRNISKLWTPPLELTPAQLALYNGTDESLPIYLAINGTIFDVTAGRSKYGPGGGYSFFSGRDATRAYVSGCFQQDLTHDIRGLERMFEGKAEDPTAEMWKRIGHWKSFFANHDKYFEVGKVVHESLEGKPIRDLCNPNAAAGGGRRG